MGMYRALGLGIQDFILLGLRMCLRVRSLQPERIVRDKGLVFRV